MPPPPNKMLDRRSKAFLLIFFGLILISIGYTYYRLEILKDFRAFTESGEIPRAVDFYLKLINRL